MYLTKLAKDGMIVLKRMHLPLYSKKYSKKTYTIHQQLLCLCIKEVQKQSYRDCRDFLDEFDNLQKLFGLTKIPHYTTPQKCLQRFPPRWYRFLLKQLILAVKSRASATTDGTGLMKTKASFSYMKRIGRRIRKREYFKVIIVVDPTDGSFSTHGMSLETVMNHRGSFPYWRTSLFLLMRSAVRKASTQRYEIMIPRVRDSDQTTLRFLCLCLCEATFPVFLAFFD